MINKIISKQTTTRLEKFFLSLILLSLLAITSNYIFLKIQTHNYQNQALQVNSNIKKYISQYVATQQQNITSLLKSHSSIQQIFNSQNSFSAIFFIDAQTKEIQINQSKAKYHQDFLYKIHKMSYECLSSIVIDNAHPEINTAPSLFIAVPYIKNKTFLGTLIFKKDINEIIQYIQQHQSSNTHSIIFKQQKDHQVSFLPTPHKMLNPINIQSKQTVDNNHIQSTSIIISPQWYIHTAINIKNVLSIFHTINLIMIMLLIISCFLFLISVIKNKNKSLIFHKKTQKIISYALPGGLCIIIFLIITQSIHLYQTINENLIKKISEQKINAQKTATLLENNLIKIAAKSYDINNFYTHKNIEAIKDLIQKNHLIQKIDIYNNETLQTVTQSSAIIHQIASPPLWTTQLSRSKKHWSNPHYHNDENISINYICKVDQNYIAIQVDLRQLLSTIFKNQKLDNQSTTLIYNNQNYIIYCSQYLKKTDNLQIKDLLATNFINQQFKNILQNKQNDTFDNASKNIMINNIPVTHWTIIQQYKKNIVHLQYNIFIIIMHLILLLSMLLTCYVIYFLYAHSLNNDSLRRTLFIISTGMMVLSIGTLFISYQYMEHKTNYIMSDLFYNFNKMLENNANQAKISKNLIPTGVFLEDFDPLDNSFSINIWQKFSADNKITPPTILNAMKEELKVYKLYEEKNNDEIKVGWKITGSLLPQKSKVFYYPFDNRIIQFIIGSKHNHNYKIFTIDASSYQTLQPQNKPGIAPKIHVKQFMINKSFFSYEQHQTETGITASKPHHLAFNIVLKRNLFNSFLLYLLPLLVIILTVMFASRNKSSSKESVQMKLIYGQASLLFALILIHQNLRFRIQLTGSSYMELLMLLGYFAILFPYLELIYPIKHQKALILKKIFMTSFMSIALFAITFYSFYN